MAWDNYYEFGDSFELLETREAVIKRIEWLLLVQKRELVFQLNFGRTFAPFQYNDGAIQLEVKKLLAKYGFNNTEVTVEDGRTTIVSLNISA